jgi:hypothetical protein
MTVQTTNKPARIIKTLSAEEKAIKAEKMAANKAAKANNDKLAFVGEAHNRIESIWKALSYYASGVAYHRKMKTVFPRKVNQTRLSELCKMDANNRKVIIDGIITMALNKNLPTSNRDGQVIFDCWIAPEACKAFIIGNK